MFSSFYTSAINMDTKIYIIECLTDFSVSYLLWRLHKTASVLIRKKKKYLLKKKIMATQVSPVWKQPVCSWQLNSGLCLHDEKGVCLPAQYTKNKI